MHAKHHAASSHMVKHHVSHQQHPNALSRRKVRYLITVISIGLAMLIGLFSILSGRFRPFAATTTPVATVPVAVMQYLLSGQYFFLNSNTIQFDLAPFPVLSLPLQGLNQSSRPGAQSTGSITIRKDGNSITDAGIPWTSNGFLDATHLNTQLTEPTLINALDKLDGATTLRLIVKPQNYLAIDVTTTNIDIPVVFPPAQAGDWKNDNKIDIGDFSQFSGSYGAAITTDNSKFDINGDGKINIGDFSIFAANYGKSGAQ